MELTLYWISILNLSFCIIFLFWSNNMSCCHKIRDFGFQDWSKRLLDAWIKLFFQFPGTPKSNLRTIPIFIYNFHLFYCFRTCFQFWEVGVLQLRCAIDSFFKLGSLLVNPSWKSNSRPITNARGICFLFTCIFTKNYMNQTSFKLEINFFFSYCFHSRQTKKKKIWNGGDKEKKTLFTKVVNDSTIFLIYIFLLFL